MTEHFDEWLKIATAPRPILLVEDSLSEVDLILEMSKDFNVEWNIAHDYPTAVELLAERHRQIKLMMLDLNLSSSPSGVELFTRVKRDFPLVPVLVFSGHITMENFTEMPKEGFVIFAHKPANFTPKFFEQLFLALNIPKKLTRNVPKQNEEVII